MKKIKYLIVIIIIGIIIFAGIEIFRKEDQEENATPTITNDQEENATPTNTNNQEENTTSTITNNQKEEIKNGEELMQKAEKTLTARGWAGASNNVIGLKEETIYYYNKETEEFYKIAEGIEDIYYVTDQAEEITAKKNSKFKENREAPEFLIYE